ncbi:hypothetical protein M426DRAFT_53781 [Hypoxylon sp. CI-4A]|nr:hypothetical protein M426DRAFT_53781 [Hypoxylon sp. CI-4A]
MSFRDNDGRRYGHIPPVQYPVANRSSQDQTSYPNRRPSFNSGDDSGAFVSPANRPNYHPTLNTSVAGLGNRDELFLASPSDPNRANYGNSGVAMAGYQHQYQPQTPPTPSTYNPQAFARSQSTTIPYLPHPSHRRAQQQSIATNIPAPAIAPAPYSPTTATPNNFTPAPYNPAAYSGSAVPQRQSTYSGYSNYNNQSYGSPPLNQSPYFQSQPTYASTPAQQRQSSTPSAPYPAGYDQPTYNSTYTSAASPPVPAQSISYDTSQTQYAASYSNDTETPPITFYASDSSSSDQVPYPTQSQIPVGPNYSATDPHSFLSRPSRSNSAASPLPSPPGHSQSLTGLTRHPTNAPLPSRPVDDIAEELYGPNGSLATGASQEYPTQDSIMQDIEAELARRNGSLRDRPTAFDQRNGALPEGDLQNLRRLTSNASYHSTATTLTNQEEPSGVNRYSSNASTLNRNHSTNPYAHEDHDGDESDPEGAAGAWALQQAEEDDRRFSSVGGTLPYFSQPEASAQPTLPTHKEEPSSDSDYAGMDLGLMGGGYAGNLTYDNNLGSPPITEIAPGDIQPLPTPRSNHTSQRSHGSNRYPAFEQADVDYEGTGGLQQPTAHRLSFDEGEERVSLHSRQSGSESPSKEDYPDMFYHPGLSNRPLPAIPASSDSSSMLSAQSPGKGLPQHGYSLSVDSRPYSGPDAQYGQNAQQLQVERSISLSSHSTSPLVQPPGRSKTDATEERNARLRQMRQQQQIMAQQGLIPYEGYDPGTPTSINYDVITLPSGRRGKFQHPEKLTVADVRSCTEPWALSGIAKWIREMAEGEPDLKKKTLEDGLVRLFCLKVPTMNVADAEALSTQVLDSMLEAGILIPDEEWLKFGPGSVSGVLWQLTGSGCYAPKLHGYDDETYGHELPTRCYSYHCTRTLKKANLDDLVSNGVKTVDWATFYNMTKESTEGKSKKEVSRQNVLHEIITSEEVYMDRLDVLRVLYRDRLLQSQPRIVAEGRIEKFVSNVFGKVDAVQQVNMDHLLAQLKYRQKEQGPWIVGFSDIFREWVRKARTAYVDYASAFPYARYQVKKEAERNFLFRQFLEDNRAHPRSQRLDWTSYLKDPITRLQRYSLLLETVLKQTIQDSEEKANLRRAIEEVKSMTLECDAKVDEMQKKVTMIELDQMLVLRPGFHADLHLDHLGRELILQGDLQRMGSKGVRWVDTHALLFDHYLILAKLVVSRDGRQDKKYDVSKEVRTLLSLAYITHTNFSSLYLCHDPISKQKGIAAPLTRSAASDTKLNKVQTNGTERPNLDHAATNSSVGTAAVNRLATANSIDSEGRILYPFRIKHLGHEVYTLFAQSAQARQDWCDRIIEAKTRHAKALHAQNAEPFRLLVMADSAFAYDPVAAIGKYVGGVHIRGTPLDRAIREVEKTCGSGRGPPPISRAGVNCATGFTAFGKNMVAVGTDAGVCVSEAGDQRGWIKTVTASRVTQIAVLEQFSVVLVLSERNLISYPLDVVAPPSSYPAPSNDNPRRSPQRLAKDVSFFATAHMKDRMLVFYKKKESLHTTFKVLEPVFQKATEKKSRLFGGSRKAGVGVTESFRDFDEFFFPTECYSLNIFHTYIAVSTARGFELLTLDKKIPMSIPDTRQPAIANIANRIKEQRPLGMFRLNDQEFLLAYEDCAVYVDKYGDVSRSVIMEYSGKQKKARGASMYGQYLLLFNEDYVEVRNAENGRLRQIIAGRDVKVLDYGVRGPTGGSSSANGQSPSLGPISNGVLDSQGTIKICMAHPEVAGQQIVLEMLLNSGHMEK